MDYCKSVVSLLKYPEKRDLGVGVKLFCSITDCHTTLRDIDKTNEVPKTRLNLANFGA